MKCVDCGKEIPDDYPFSICDSCWDKKYTQKENSDWCDYYCPYCGAKEPKHLYEEAKLIGSKIMDVFYLELECNKCDCAFRVYKLRREDKR
jgi:hypothetical protein